MKKMNHILETSAGVINHYLEQIKDNQPLTMEEEQELGRRILSGDTAARNKLIEANLRFVLTCAINMATHHVPIEELIAAGVLPADYDFESHKELVPMQPGDVPVTFADTTPLERDFGFRPSTPLRHGLRAFARWYAGYYGTN